MASTIPHLSRSFGVNFEIIKAEKAGVYDVKVIRSQSPEAIIPIVIKTCAFVISTGGPRSGLKWRDLAANEKQVWS